MISEEFSSAFETEIRRIEQKIADESAQLRSEEDAERAELLRVRVKYLGKLFEAMKAGRSQILTAEAAVGQMEGKFSKWWALCTEAREAQEVMEALAKKVLKTREACSAPEKVVRRAEVALEWQRSLLVPKFATEPQKRRRLEEERKVQKEYDEAVAHFRECLRVRDETQREWMSAATKFDGACFRERMARLPDEVQRFQNQETLAATG